jgi:hypothetical protein
VSVVSVTELQISVPVHFGMLEHLSAIVMVGPLPQESLGAKFTQDTDFYSSVRAPQFPTPSFRHPPPDSMRPAWLHPPQLRLGECFPDNDMWRRC